MKTKKDIVDNWLPRYTGRELKDFSKYILLTNFEYYLELFSELYQVPIVGADKTMPNVSCNGITLVNFGMGSPNAATILDLLSAIEPCFLSVNVAGLRKRTPWVIIFFPSLR